MVATLKRRGGFTLVELLVVVAIIAVLVSLAAAGAFRLIASQRAGRTEDTIRTLDKALHQQWNAVVEDAKKEEPSEAVLDLAGGNRDIARILWVKFRLAEAFPQSYKEIQDCFDFTGSPPVPTNAQKASLYGINMGNNASQLQDPSWIPLARRKYRKVYYDRIDKTKNPLIVNTQPATQSSALLYLSLTVGRAGIKLPEDQLQTFLADTDNDGLKEFVDGWGKPLRFYRFPIYDPANLGNGGSAELAGLNPRAGQAKQSFADPYDPNGLLQQLDNGTPQRPWYGRLFIYPPNPPPLYPPNLPAQLTNGDMMVIVLAHSFPAAPNPPQPYWMPYIASNGNDGTPLTGDDIYSFRLRVGARGD